MVKKKYCVSLDPSIYEKIKKRAEEERRKLSAVIEMALIEYLERENNK